MQFSLWLLGIYLCKNLIQFQIDRAQCPWVNVKKDSTGRLIETFSNYSEHDIFWDSNQVSK